MEKEKLDKNQNIILHGLINFCLLVIVVLTIAGCGLFSSYNAVTVSKTYRGVIYAGNENSGKVALMINVYWGTEYLLDMLDILDEYDVKCTFFVGKTWAEEYPSMLRKIYESGHEIGNHGSNHKEHAKLSYKDNATEINGCHDIVYKITGVNMNLFAPPGGSYSSDTVKCAEELGYKTILWTRDTIDWRDHDEEIIYQRAVADCTSGDLILMHPTEATKNALKRIIETIKSKNLMLDTVTNTIKD